MKIKTMVRYASGGAVALAVAAAGSAMTSSVANAVGCGVSISGTDLVAGGSITCDDKTFSDWYIHPSALGTATAIDPSAISVTASINGLNPSEVDLQYGIAGFSATGTGNSNDLAFGYVVHDTGSPIIGVNQSSFGSTGSINMGATYTDSHGNVLANLVNTANGTVSASISPGVSALAVNKDWAVSGTSAGTPSQISNAAQSYLQASVPEIDAASGTGAIGLLLGAMALAGERRRRRAA